MKFFLSSAAVALLSGTPVVSTPLARPLRVTGEQAARRDWVRDPALDQRLKDALESVGAPGAVGAVLKLGEPIRVGAFGVRKAGVDTAIEPEDLVHIGSDTKAMTAVLVARLVQQGKLRWDATVGETLKSIADEIDPGFRSVTVTQLLQHTAGVPSDAEDWWAYPDEELRERRLRLARDGMKRAPEAEPGTRHQYSNLSVMIAGAMAEVACDKEWETLMREEVFQPLGMDSAGFGVPGTLGRVDQPWGHGEDDEGAFVPVQLDNDPALGPAGTVHLSMSDWGRFVSVFLMPAEGSSETLAESDDGAFLSADSRTRLLTSGVKGGNYGMGWIVVQRPWAQGDALTHAGSN
ncbi:MAG: serine hydrolase domain-containing protein, partial [Planctomycetota bacterium]